VRTQFALETQVTVGAMQDLGDTPLGRRRVVPITGGTFEGPRIKGTVMPGGADWQLIRSDGVAELEARYILRTDDGAMVPLVNRALRHGPAEVMQRLAAGQVVDPDLYYFRGAPVFHAPTGKHDWLNRAIFVADGVRQPDLVIVRVYEVL
jgi:hypothetical protein